MINLSFLNLDQSNYKSISQQIRNTTESWVSQNIFCPRCGAPIIQYPNNHKCADFHCKSCQEDYELKSKKDNFGKKIVDGEYNSMIKKINSQNPSNFFFLNYHDEKVNNFFTIPKFFFSSDIIEKRNPLSSTARRAGWIGCNILYNQLPDSAKIFYVKDSIIQNEDDVINNYRKILFVAEKPPESKGWLLDVMFCIEDLIKKKLKSFDCDANNKIFTLKEISQYENFLFLKHQENHNVIPKIRQQLQFLRDKGFVEFVDNKGTYRLLK